MGPLLVQAKIRGEEQEWARLIARTAQGDQAAFGTMYDKTSVRIYGLILRILGDRASAEEVTIDVFTQCGGTRAAIIQIGARPPVGS